LVDSFVNSIVLHDDRIEFYFNFKKGAKELSLDDLEKCLVLFGSLPPKILVTLLRGFLLFHSSLFSCFLGFL